MKTTKKLFSHRPAPLRVIRQWIFGERALRGPAAIELDVLERQIVREEAAIKNVTGEAVQIETRLTDLRTEMNAALTDTTTPGVITAEESSAITRRLLDTAVLANQHTEHLKELS